MVKTRRITVAQVSNCARDGRDESQSSLKRETGFQQQRRRLHRGASREDERP